ncbi:MAG: hypothetical protein H7333_06920 [Bdellovibrionales bacterium]|nr:hypothetical protein [Oligoflexia bacterium]
MIILLALISISVKTASAEETKHQAQIIGASARTLFQALIKVLPRKDNRVDFDSIECAYKAPSAGADYCEVNKKRYKTENAATREIASALKNIKTGSQSTNSGWNSAVLKGGFCTTERGHFYCFYDYVMP